MEHKTSPAQIKASRKWEQKNRTKATIQTYRRTASMFIRNHATLEDLTKLEALIAHKREILLSKQYNDFTDQRID